MTNEKNKQETTTVKQSMGIFDWVMLITLSILWGGSFFFQGVAVKELPTFTIVNLRVAIAAITLWIVLIFLKFKFPTSWKIWISFFMMGALNNALPFSLIVWGQHSIGSGLASILNATTPLFTVIAAGIFLRDEPVSYKKIIGVIIGFIGVAIMIGPKALSGINNDIFAQLSCLCAAISYALAGVFGRRFKQMKIDPLVVAAGQVTASTVILSLFTILIEAPWNLPMPNIVTWQSIICLAVFSTAIAYFLYFKILASAGATNLLLVTFLIPATSILLGTIFLDEKLASEHVIGILLIGVGLSFIDGRILKSFKVIR